MSGRGELLVLHRAYLHACMHPPSRGDKAEAQTLCCSQDEAWQRRNRAAVTSVEVPVEVPVSAAANGGGSALAELHRLSSGHQPTQHADTVLGTWLFIEKLHISDINANVTVTLSSNIAALLNYGAEEGAEEGELQPQLQGNQLLHVVKSSGFQLINVNNVAMQLKVHLSHPCCALMSIEASLLTWLEIIYFLSSLRAAASSCSNELLMLGGQAWSAVAKGLGHVLSCQHAEEWVCISRARHWRASC